MPLIIPVGPCKGVNDLKAVPRLTKRELMSHKRGIKKLRKCYVFGCCWRGSPMVLSYSKNNEAMQISLWIPGIFHGKYCPRVCRRVCQHEIISICIILCWSLKPTLKELLSNHPSTIVALWMGSLSCWTRPQPSEHPASKRPCTWSLV